MIRNKFTKWELSTHFIAINNIIKLSSTAYIFYILLGFIHTYIIIFINTYTVFEYSENIISTTIFILLSVIISVILLAQIYLRIMICLFVAMVDHSQILITSIITMLISDVFSIVDINMTKIQIWFLRRQKNLVRDRSEFIRLGETIKKQVKVISKDKAFENKKYALQSFSGITYHINESLNHIKKGKPNSPGFLGSSGYGTSTKQYISQYDTELFNAMMLFADTFDTEYFIVNETSRDDVNPSIFINNA